MLQGLKDLFKQFLKPSGHSTEVIILQEKKWKKDYI